MTKPPLGRNLIWVETPHIQIYMDWYFHSLTTWKTEVIIITKVKSLAIYSYIAAYMYISSTWFWLFTEKEKM
jgi:hypothetical protein